MRAIVTSALGFVVLAGAVPVPQLSLLNPTIGVGFDRSALSRVPLVGPIANSMANTVFDIASGLPVAGPILAGLLGGGYHPYAVAGAPVSVVHAVTPVVSTVAVAAPPAPAISIVDNSTNAAAAPDASSDATAAPTDAAAAPDSTDNAPPPAADATAVAADTTPAYATAADAAPADAPAADAAPADDSAAPAS